VLLLLLAAYAVVRAIEVAQTRAGTWWLVAAGAFVGLGFLAKMLQAFLVVPVFAVVFLLAAPGPVRRRLGQLVASGLAMLVAGGWWVGIVELIPASARPYIGGSQNNSVLDLMFGYNGFGRLDGSETGSVGGGNGWGQTGLTRMFGAEIGGQVAWLLPAALGLLVIGLWRSARAPRTDRARAGYLLWGGWLLITGLTFSLMAGIFHAYYTVALAPAIGAVVGIGAVQLWRERGTWMAAGPLLGVLVAVTGLWSWDLLGRSSAYLPWLRPLVLVAAAVAAIGLIGVSRLPRGLALGAAGLGLTAALAGSASYAVQTAGTAHTGAIPSAGPTVAGARFGPGGGAGGGPGGMAGGAGGQRFGRQFNGQGGFGGQFGGQAGGQQGFGGQGGFGGQFGGQAGGQTGGQAGGQQGFGGQAGGMRGGMGGLLDATTPSSELVAALRANASSYTWAAATVGANNAAGYQLASGQSVMPLGGFNGSDPSPTLAQFQQWVAQGRIHYFIGGGIGMQSNGGSNTAQAIAAWVAQNYTASTIGGTTVYDLTSAVSSATTGSSGATTGNV
jgi:4-amino-4-deoxy-L-arabinose transferase-like glycosyltransferase